MVLFSWFDEGMFMYPIEVSKNPKHEPKVWQIISIQITLVVISLIFMGKAMGSLTKE